MYRFILLAIAFVTAWTLCAENVSANPPAGKKNIIMIVADDLNNDLGCYGHPLVKTPHLDRLCKRGVRFEHAYCQSPVCNPSRTSFLSGMRPGTKIKKLKNFMFLPDLLRAAGYQTVEIGKVTHGYGITATAIRWDVNKKGRIDNALDFLREKHHKPFFLAIGLTHTHPGYSHTRENLKLYPPDKLSLRNHPKELLDSLPDVAFRGLTVNAKISDADRRKHIARYYAAITTMDEDIGKLLDVLEEQKLWDNTIVIFFSDHGRHLGEFGGVFDKRTLFEASAGVPLIMAAPNSIKGKHCERLVELVDVYPTLTDLCGIPTPKVLEGKSFAPLLKEPQLKWKQAAFSSANIRGTPARSVRTERYRFIEWPGHKKAALFDYQTDPREQRNLYSDPEYVTVIADMRKLLEKNARQE